MAPQPGRYPFLFAAIVIAVVLAAGVAWQWRATTPDLSAFGNVIVAPEPDAQTVKAYVIFPTTNSAPGLAHYTEHLSWLSSAGKREDAVNSHSNAWASRFTTGYWLSGSPAALPGILATLADLFDPLDLDGSFAEEERGIIQREYDLRMAGNPAAQAADDIAAFLYNGSALATSVIGTRDDIAALSYDAARDLHAQTHQPHLATVIITGPISARDVHTALTAAEWPATDGAQSAITPQPITLAAPAETTLRYPDADVAPRLLWRKAVNLPETLPFDQLEVHAALLASILDTNLPGGLAGPLRFDAAIARTFDIQVWPLDEDTIEVSFSASPDRDVSLTELQTALEETLADIASNGIPQATFERVMGRFEDFWPDWDDADEAASWMASYAIDRASIARAPLSKGDVKGLADTLSLPTTNMILRQLTGEGRTATAFIGPEEIFE